MSEDEDSQSNQANGNRPNIPRSSGPALTQDYLASVLASIRSQPLATAQPQQQQQQQPAQSQIIQQPVTRHQQAQTSGLTRDYFQNVMQQIFTPPAAQSDQPANATPTTAASSTLAQTPRQSNISDADLADKLEQMHELGLFDDELNLRALQITEGNVDAAVSLIIEGGRDF